MSSSIIRGILICLILMPVAPAAAQDAGTGALPVRLSDAALEALQASPAVWEARVQWLIRKTQVQGAWGNFEPALVSGVSRNYQDQRNTAQQVASFQGEESKELRTEYQVAVEGKFFSGAGYRLGYTLADITQDYSVLSPATAHQYESKLAVQVDQPLLKGIARGSPLIPMRLARNEELIAFHTYRREMISVVSKVEAAYWDLALAQDLHGIAAESVRMAQEIAADARERVGVGKMSDLDLSEAEIQLVIRVTEEESSRIAISEAAAQLRLVLGGGRIGSTVSLSAAEPLEIDSPSGVLSSDQAESRVQEALKLQPEILISRRQLEKSDIQLDYRLDQRLPELNARASFGLQGLEDSVTGSLETLQNQSFPTWSLGLQFRLPVLGNLQAQSLLEEARLTKELAVRKAKAMERDTSISTAALFQRVLSLGRQAENARAVSGFKRRLLDVERARFDTGKSDIRRLYDAEQALSESRKKELESYRRFRRATVDLSTASGTTLRDKGFETTEGELITLSPVLLSDPWK